MQTRCASISERNEPWGKTGWIIYVCIQARHSSEGGKFSCKRCRCEAPFSCTLACETTHTVCVCVCVCVCNLEVNQLFFHTRFRGPRIAFDIENSQDR